MQNIKQFAPLIRRLITLNSPLLLYFIMPNFSSFLAVTVIFILIFKIKINSQKQSTQQGQAINFDINTVFNEYLKGQTIKQIIVIVFIGLLVRIAYMFPSWLVILVTVQLYGCSQLLIKFGIVQLFFSNLTRMEQSVKKMINLIPRYQQVQA